MRRFSAGVQRLREPVNKYEQAQPDNVNEMPVPCDRLETKMVIRREMALDAADEDDRQHDRAQRDMKAVKTREHKEG